MGMEHFPCFAHTLQLSIKNGLNVSQVQRVLGRCKKLVEHFKKSTKETYKLREKQEMLKLPQHKLIQDCVTRWGSTLAMLERLMEQQAAIAAVLMEGKVRHLMPEGEEWSVIELLVEVLRPFQQATEAVKYPTLSTVKPLLYKLLERTLKIEDSDSATAKKVKTAIKKDLEERYQTAALKRLMNVATYLDPRYKELPFLSPSSTRNVIDQVEDELLDMPSQPEEAQEAYKKKRLKDHRQKSKRKALLPNFLEICFNTRVIHAPTQTR